MRTFVALTPLAGTLALPFLVPILMVKVGIGTAVGMAVLVSTLWFVLMLRTAEMPGHH
ncbi:hypothetical protein VB734_03865 [Synechococcus sp. BA-124 BA4]|jgi:hypothetical protein|uniref:hypothetical protein n=1 Tax=unclassified Synechococcus TaxID=2626047 RepID=UPI0018CF6062|nr:MULTISPECIES: hypothetical protein [unclassified Synechococcus]MEA5399173.1 hypothetical protein [Synechococcus sp. BA-124 BA4]QPN57463.1 hypothetical protein I1E95_04950 [Synechococcus sp. CBW1107]CAK6701366.1 hypothetical protein BBFGKLBO_03092 [Synechococcus sp. CBW1107]